MVIERDELVLLGFGGLVGLGKPPWLESFARMIKFEVSILL